MYIYNEALQWAINGVNKIFTAINNIESIESLRIWYVEYTNFTFSGNTITLTDAPTVFSWAGGVYIDYYSTSGTPAPSSVNLIYNEEAQWETDWINTVFTLIYPIDIIEELRVGWVSYTNFTFNWRFITLAAAPSQEVRVDYYRKDADVPTIDSWITLSQLRSSIYRRLGQTITSLQFPIELADEYISEGITRISKMKRDRIKRGVTTFHKAFDSTILSVSQNKITCWVSKYLPYKGVAIIDWGNKLLYSNKDNDWISSINWLEVDDVAGRKIQFGYKLSRKIEKVSEVFMDWIQLSPQDFAEYRLGKAQDWYCVDNWYLFLPYNLLDWKIITIVYITRSNSSYSEDDIIDFNWDYIPVIKSFVLWNMYKDREDDRFQIEYENYKQLLKEYKRELSKQYETTSTFFKTKSPLDIF